MFGVRRTRYAGVAGRHREHFASPSPSSGSQLNIDRPMAGRGWSAPSLASGGLHTSTPMYPPIARLRFQHQLRFVGADRAMSVSYSSGNANYLTTPAGLSTI